MNQRSTLIKVDSVAYLTGKTVDAIFRAVDGPELFESGLRWVFNVAADPNGQVRDLRFWTREVIAPETTEKFSLDQVVKMLLPPARKEYPSGEVCELLQIRRRSLADLREQLNGRLAANCSFFPRAGLEQFLRRRWLGSVHSPQSTVHSPGRVAA
jgi:hypothetical protein